MIETDPAERTALPARDARALRRLERRELHRSRSLSASIALWATALALAAPGALVLAERAGLAIPGVHLPGADAVASLAGAAGPVGIVVGAAAAAFGLVLLVLALAPGRRQRHALERDGIAVIVDDRVLASAISRTAARAARATPDRARTVVGRGSAAITLRPATGFRLDATAAREAGTTLVEHLRPRGAMRVVAKEERA